MTICSIRQAVLKMPLWRVHDDGNKGYVWTTDVHDDTGDSGTEFHFDLSVLAHLGRFEVRAEVKRRIMYKNI